MLDAEVGGDAASAGLGLTGVAAGTGQGCAAGRGTEMPENCTRIVGVRHAAVVGAAKDVVAVAIGVAGFADPRSGGGADVDDVAATAGQLAAFEVGRAARGAQGSALLLAVDFEAKPRVTISICLACAGRLSASRIGGCVGIERGCVGVVCCGVHGDVGGV